jgi:hypothetical protein
MTKICSGVQSSLKLEDFYSVVHLSRFQKHQYKKRTMSKLIITVTLGPLST